MSVISCHIDNHIATLALSNPKVGNALGEAFWRDLPKVAAELQQNADVHAVVIVGEGKHFCVGIDLPFAQATFIGPATAEQRAERVAAIENMQDGLQAIEKLDVPVIAAIHGACIGAGVELATCADIRLCTQDAVFALKEIQLAIIPDLGGLQRLPRQLAAGIARELAYTGRNFSAAEALQWQWVNNTFADIESLHAAAQALATELAAYAPRAMRHIKRSLSDTAIAQDLEDMRILIAPQVDECIAIDMVEMLRATQEKRPAAFTPRPVKINK
jgi:enoyl-CoA hydratase